MTLLIRFPEALAALLLWCGGTFAAELILPSRALERTGEAHITLRLRTPATGQGTVHFLWTDSYGRVVDDRTIEVSLHDESEIGLALDMRRAVAMKNTLRATFSLKDRSEEAETELLASPPERDWSDYHIIMWQNHPAELWPKLKSLGIDGGQYNGKNKPPAPFLYPFNLRWYAENIATDFYAEYHRYRADRPVNWSWLQAKELLKQNPDSLEAFKRRPSLSDPVWLRKIHDRLVEAAKAHSPYRPFFYDLGDESGVADLASFWDFDFSDASLEGMRAWLRQRYGSLEALNRQWGSSFTAWERVMPDTTAQAMKRTGENYSSWADHKEWMDIAFAEALRMGVDAVRSVDPRAYVGIAGGQMPGWGGYDYARLCKVLTFIEPYDIGNNIEMIRSFAPDIPVVTTSFASGPRERHRVWYELLHGNRGLILWDDKADFVKKDGTTGARGAEVQPYYTELRGGLGALLIQSRRMSGPVAIHYSQASLRTRWMLRRRGEGERWINRTSKDERLDSEFLLRRESWCRLIEDLGLQYDFISYDALAQGGLIRQGYQVLILPDSNSLSAAEAASIRDFAERGGTVIEDGPAGIFDEHSRRLPEGRFANWSGRFTHIDGDIPHYCQARLMGQESGVLGAARRLFAGPLQANRFQAVSNGVQGAAGIELHTFRNGAATIAALHSNPQLRVDELGPPEFKSNARFEKPVPVTLRLPEEMRVYDVRRGAALGLKKEIPVTVDPYEPVILAAVPWAPSRPQVSAPGRIRRGDTFVLGISIESPLDANVFHLDTVNPSGTAVEFLSGNVTGAMGRASRVIPLAHNDPAGTWEFRVRDILTGQTQVARTMVE